MGRACVCFLRAAGDGGEVAEGATDAAAAAAAAAYMVQKLCAAAEMLALRMAACNMRSAKEPVERSAEVQVGEYHDVTAVGRRHVRRLDKYGVCGRWERHSACCM